MALSAEQARARWAAWNGLVAPLKRVAAVELEQLGEPSWWVRVTLGWVECELVRFAPIAFPLSYRQHQAEPNTVVDHVNDRGGSVTGEPAPAFAPDRSHAVPPVALATNPDVHSQTVSDADRSQKGS